MAKKRKSTKAPKRRVKKINPTLKKGKWISAKIRVTKGGKIEAKVPKSAVK